MDDDDFMAFLLDDEDEQEEEDEDLLMIVALVAGVSEDTRPSFFVRDRIIWNAHVNLLMQKGPDAFSRLYRMSLQSFNKLCGLLRPYFDVDVSMSQVRTGAGPITIEIAMHCLLRWLSGGSYLDIKLCAGISKASFYRVIYKCVDLINCHSYFKISFPTTTRDLETAANNFKSLSSNGVIDGCVACLDGFLLPITTPFSNETENVKAFFSGHYQPYGINIQAVYML